MRFIDPSGLKRNPSEDDYEGNHPVYPGIEPVGKIGIGPITIWYRDPASYEQCINTCSEREVACAARGAVMCALRARAAGKCINPLFERGGAPPEPTPGTNVIPPIFMDCYFYNYLPACKGVRKTCVMWCAKKHPFPMLTMYRFR